MNSKKLAETIEFAAIAHDGAYRKGTHIPYVTHVIEAGLIALSLTDDEYIVIAAILHDIVEDTSFELTDIEKKFDSKMLNWCLMKAKIKCSTSLRHIPGR
jgi:hypothetical protein